MNTHPTILRVDATRTDQNYFTFAVVFDSPAGEFTCPVSIDGLVDYFQFQREVLAASGVFYRYVLCEGRERLHANEFWKEFVASFLRTSRIYMPEVQTPVN